MKNVLSNILKISFLIIVSLLFSCKKTAEPVRVDFIFRHYVNGNPLQLNSMQYVNAAGNHYQVDELQYFVSEIRLHGKKGIAAIDADSAIHYVDLAIPATLQWKPGETIPADDYDSISFVFGIVETKNKTGLFVNPPERDMFWPEVMGGGYHYMKMNGKWLSTGDTIKAFNLHLGIGMEMQTGKMTFVQNYFMIRLPLNFSTGKNDAKFEIRMNIEKWFDQPDTWDWNQIGGHIMQNQAAMKKACENGLNAFEVLPVYDK